MKIKVCYILYMYIILLVKMVWTGEQQLFESDAD
jgi:hypothetical protein